MLYGNGGYHNFVLPFLNFSIFGVVFIPALTVFFLIRLERFAFSSYNVHHLSFVMLILGVIPHWVWYSDKIFINFIITFFALSQVYKIFLGMSFGHVSRSS